MKPGPDNRVVLTVDIGSSSLRAALYSVAGDPVSTGVKLECRFTYSPDGMAVLDPDELLGLFASAVDAVVLQAKDREIIAVAVSSFWHSLLGLDGRGRPATPVYTWADRRAAVAVRRLKSRFPARTLHDLTGCPPHSSYWPAKLLWLQSEYPETYTSTSRWVSPVDYIYLNLFGRLSSGTSMASATGIFDRNSGLWSDRVMSEIGLDGSMLSGVSDEPYRGLRGNWSNRWPELSGTPWYPASGDGACSNVGSGCLGRSRIALMVGTSGAMRVAWREARAEVPPGLWCYRVDGERFVSGGALSDGGSLIEWVNRNFRVKGSAERSLSEMEPDAHGLTFLPLLSGERGPGWSDLANGVIAGLSMTTGPLEVLRAAMESVALRFALISERISGVASEDARVIASGGGLINSPVWVGIMADALGRVVEVPEVDEASSRGAALLALDSLGCLSLEDPNVRPPIARTVEPDPKAHETYRAALERQTELYAAVVSPKPEQQGEK
ncbi:gluconokinase [Rubrobacter indicoceani]|uniref:gluconokinase n=1 Tax=Rubrobacter indicoceani TaxID=2051957 RepID=UPI000E5A116F|nr:gluconokinase [Rubrobacter indicoceani]